MIEISEAWQCPHCGEYEVNVVPATGEGPYNAVCTHKGCCATGPDSATPEEAIFSFQNPKFFTEEIEWLQNALLKMLDA